MARAAPRICTYPGCNALVRKGRCGKHPATTSRADYREIKRQSRERTDRSDRIYSLAWWRKLRMAKLRHDPLCEHCAKQGKIVQASHVDHIVPISEGGAERDWDNLQSLCKPCHTAKTNSERAARKRREGG